MNQQRSVCVCAGAKGRAELCRFSRFLVSHAGSWHPELASSHRRRHATGFGSVAISTAAFRTLVATTPQRLVDFFLEHDLDRLQYPLTQPKLDELPVLAYRCLRCLLLVMPTHPSAKKALTLHLARSEGHERYFGCNLMHRKVLASSHQHLMAEAPLSRRSSPSIWTQCVRRAYRAVTLSWNNR